jgi:hypothetical protein
MIGKHAIYSVLFLLTFFCLRQARADDDYKIGSPTLTKIWVDPVHGLDRPPPYGTTRALAYKTVQWALGDIPGNKVLNNTGYVIMLVPGTYGTDNVPSEIQSLWGTANYPVIFQAADDTGTVNFPSVDITVCRYLYMIGLHVIHSGGSGGSYAISFRGCDHILLRNCNFTGADSTSSDTVTTGVVFYQSPYCYLERSVVSGIVSANPGAITKDAIPSGNAVDIYASQYGHIKECSLHDFAGNGVLMRGGSGYYTIEENTIAHGGKGGIVFYTRDTTNGLDVMILPWVHYEVYDIKCFNNIIHHTGSAGFSCSGGYNILFAFNTLYQTGINSSLLVLNLARRSRAVDKDFAQAYMDSGAWGTWYLDRGDDSDSAPIPNKNIFIYNNIFSNSPDSATTQPHFTFAGAYTTPSVNASCPRPALADDNLQIKGNIIWNGDASKPLGINASSGCGSSNPNCNEQQLLADNLINAAEPTFVDPFSGNFHPAPTSIVFTISKTYPVPDFSWTGLPPKPIEPAGNISNAVAIDRDSNLRKPAAPIAGAFIITHSSVNQTTDEEISLQNYPNPSRMETTIAFHLPSRTHATLEVYDLLGKRVALLTDEMFDAGDHEINWKTSSVEAGVYFCRLSTESSVMTKRITVIK